MKFGSVPVTEAEGGIAVHSIRKAACVLEERHSDRAVGRLPALRAAGCRRARGGAARARRRVGGSGRRRTSRERSAGEGVRVDRAFTGRANLFADEPGVLVVDKTAIDCLNLIDEAVTFADAAGVQAGGRRRDDRHRQDHSVCGCGARCATRPLASSRARRAAAHSCCALIASARSACLDRAAGARHQGDREDAYGNCRALKPAGCRYRGGTPRRARGRPRSPRRSKKCWREGAELVLVFGASAICGPARRHVEQRSRPLAGQSSILACRLIPAICSSWAQLRGGG